MIYTLTLNPALDYVVSLDSLTPGGLNRLRQTQIVCGGKGINVSTMLHRLGVKSITLGFAAGFAPEVLPAMIVGKRTGGGSAIAVALLLTKKDKL